MKETLVLRSAKAPASYVFPLSLRNLTAKLVDGQVVLSDRDGRQRGVIPAGYMVDAGSGTAGPATSTKVGYELVTTGDRPALKMTLDAAWLRDPARVYPVAVDPTVGPPVKSGGPNDAMYVQGGNTIKGGDELIVGKSGGSPSAAYLQVRRRGGRHAQPHHLRCAALRCQPDLRIVPAAPDQRAPR